MIMALINIIGFLFVGLIIWWFWIYKKNARIITASDLVEVKVKDGVYQPAEIHAAMGKPITLRFIREDAAPCAEFVIFDKLNISKQLPLNESVEIKVTPTQIGEYEFTCQMGMYRGKLIFN